jgi:acetate---CoA ligase (ADP-forming)
VTASSPPPAAPLPATPPSGGRRDLEALFAPASVAIVGASDDEAKWGHWLARQALVAGGERAGGRRIHLVNRRGEPVLGRATVRSLAELPEPVELVVIAVPAAAFEAAVEDALAAGASAIVGITAGFAELGAEGAAREAAVVRRVREAGAVLLGPNCLGVVDTTTGLCLVSDPVPSGSVGLISQSGNMALELAAFLRDRRLGFSRFASLGNQADLTAADLLEACAAHPGTEVVAAYVEDFVDGRRFAAAAAAAVAAGKPVVLLTVGRSAAAARSARSHTGALTSDAAVVRAACEAAGVDLVATPREMADLVLALRGGRRPAGRRVAVVADGGGHASLASDLATAHGLDVPAFAPELQTTLAGLLPPSAGITNPIDLAGAGEQDIRSFARVLDAVLDADAADAVLVTGYFGGYGAYGAGLGDAEVATAERMAAIAAERGAPVVVHTMAGTGRATDALREGSIPVFRAVEDAARTLGLLGARAGAAPPGIPPLPQAAPPLQAEDYWTARELFRAAGLALPEARLVHTGDEAAAAAAALGPPVVLKALGQVHKSDGGGVVLGLATPEAVRAAHAELAARLAAPAFSVERMVDLEGGVELIVGVQRDPRFGPVAMVGLGGVLTEVLRDVAFALAPLEPAGARALLDRLAAAPLLRGVRGRPAMDLDAAADAIARLTRVAAAHPELAAAEANPLLARPDGAVALDARVVLAPAPSTGTPRS